MRTVPVAVTTAFTLAGRSDRCARDRSERRYLRAGPKRRHPQS
ncbi:MAG TPA: hypothetical protein VGH43_08305 [Jatrophihabitans sp.]